jgi:short subunit dehydrogenase-like uncharacterized protein
MAAAASPRVSRKLDIVLWGATGFTGKLTAEYLTKQYGVGKDLAWAIGGRSKEKLEEVRRDLAAIDPAARDLPLVIADARDPASLAALVGSTRVVATTVGPYAMYGRELVAACAEHGTDYCDLTGETTFIREMIDRHHARAKETGARIVNCCGFDSIPSDLGVLMLQEHMREKHEARCSRVKFFLVGTRGGVSGGTIASIMNLLEQAEKDPSIRKIAFDPYALDPDRKERGPDGPDQRTVKHDDDLDIWTGPFVMAAINTRVVRRTNALLGYAYGNDFRYSEVTGFGKGAAGWARATAMTAGIGAFLGAASVGPLRAALKSTVLPAPGEGPSREKRDNGFFKVKLVGIGESKSGAQVKLLGRVEGKSDPGYGETAKMLSESAIALAKDPIPTAGGVLTPASCLGNHLLERLRRAGMTFEVGPLA